MWIRVQSFKKIPLFSYVSTYKVPVGTGTGTYHMNRKLPVLLIFFIGMVLRYLVHNHLGTYGTGTYNIFFSYKNNKNV